MYCMNCGHKLIRLADGSLAHDPIPTPDEKHLRRAYIAMSRTSCDHCSCRSPMSTEKREQISLVQFEARRANEAREEADRIHAEAVKKE